MIFMRYDRVGACFFSLLLSPSLYEQNSYCWYEKSLEMVIQRWYVTYTGRYVAAVIDYIPCDPVTFENDTVTP